MMDAFVDEALTEDDDLGDLPVDERRRPARPIVAVGAVILRGSEVLLIRRASRPSKGQWSLPGGAQELGETVLDALHREIREELGLMIEVGGLIDVIDYIEYDEDGDDREPNYHYTLVDYWATIARGYPRPLDGVVEARFVSLGTLADYGLWPRTEEIIHRAFAMANPPATGSAE